MADVFQHNSDDHIKGFLTISHVVMASNNVSSLPQLGGTAVTVTYRHLLSEQSLTPK